MPELPEVEATRRMIAESILGLVIKDVCAIEQGGGPRTGLFDDIIICEDQSEQSILKALKGKQVDHLGRKGKQMWINFTPKGIKNVSTSTVSKVTSLLIHLGMTGAVIINGKAGIKYKNFDVKDPVWPPRFSKLTITFTNGTSLAFVDPRRLGRILLRVNNVYDSNPVAGLAPDALTDAICSKRVHEICSKTTAPMKALLLDQHRLVSGVGNWVCDDVLYHSGIHPETSGNSLTLDDVRRLVDALQHVCKEACRVDADHEKFPKHWLFHARWRKGAKGQETFPDGRIAMFSTVAGRTTCHIPAAQKKRQATGVRAKITKNTKATKSDKKVREESSKSKGGCKEPKASQKVTSSRRSKKQNLDESKPPTVSAAKPLSGRAATKNTAKTPSKKNASKKNTSAVPASPQNAREKSRTSMSKSAHRDTSPMSSSQHAVLEGGGGESASCAQESVTRTLKKRGRAAAPQDEFGYRRSIRRLLQVSATDR